MPRLGPLLAVKSAHAVRSGHDGNVHKHDDTGRFGGRR
jgi:hypothetical protein